MAKKFSVKNQRVVSLMVKKSDHEIIAPALKKDWTADDRGRLVSIKPKPGVQATYDILDAPVEKMECIVRANGTVFTVPHSIDDGPVAKIIEMPKDDEKKKSA